MNKFQRDLESLREGKLSFHAFTNNHTTRFHKWARYFFERYNPSGIDIDDLVQEALLEAWRAVDSWDPTRSPIDKFVQYRVGERIDRELKRVKGWPKKGRPEKPQTIYMNEIDYSVLEDKVVLSPSDRIELEQVVCSLKTSLEQDVVAGVGLGAPLRVVAAYLYRDSKKREDYKFQDRDQAVRTVRSTIKRVTKDLESAKVERRLSTF